MGLYDGKTALITGVANGSSIAWGIAEALHAEGARLGFSYATPNLERAVTFDTPVLAVHYAEIARKVRNRQPFLRRLRNNILVALKGEPVRHLRNIESRLLVRLDDAARKVQRRGGSLTGAHSGARPRTPAAAGGWPRPCPAADGGRSGCAAPSRRAAARPPRRPSAG